jgi:ribonuclease J
MMAFVKAAEDLGKKIVLEGRSVKTNMDIAKAAGYYTPKKDTIINIKDIDQYPSNRIVIICTGGQGEEFAALPRMARGDHKYVKLNYRDTVILSSSVIPGNEISVRLLKDKLMRHDVNLIHYKTSDVHSTGHGNAEELG